VAIRAFAVLGPAEVFSSLGAFAAVLVAGGWRWGAEPPPALLATASGTAFAAIVLGQLANAYACRSEVRPFFRLSARTNSLLLFAIASELLMLIVFVGIPQVASVLGSAWPSAFGWAAAATAIPILIMADTIHKGLIRARPAGD
jgi:hypothetical protein